MSVHRRIRTTWLGCMTSPTLYQAILVFLEEGDPWLAKELLERKGPLERLDFPVSLVFQVRVYQGSRASLASRNLAFQDSAVFPASLVSRVRVPMAYPVYRVSRAPLDFPAPLDTAGLQGFPDRLASPVSRDFLVSRRRLVSLVTLVCPGFPGRLG